MYATVSVFVESVGNNGLIKLKFSPKGGIVETMKRCTGIGVQIAAVAVVVAAMGKAQCALSRTTVNIDAGRGRETRSMAGVFIERPESGYVHLQ